MAKITAPVKGFKGTVAGVKFEDGKGETDDKNALAYFRRKGYGIGNSNPTGTGAGKDQPEPADPREVAQTRVGEPLRDGAVDPRPGDFLGPTNAGEANPHGPDVVNPELHASQGVRPVKGGDVHVDSPDTQDAAETAHAGNATDGTPVDSIEVPEGDLDSRVEWIGEGETEDERRARAAAVYAQEQEAGDTDLDALGERLREVVYSEPAPEPPAGNASTEAWQEYAKTQGATDEDLDGKGRDELRDTYGPKA